MISSIVHELETTEEKRNWRGFIYPVPQNEIINLSYQINVLLLLHYLSTIILTINPLYDLLRTNI